MPQGFGLQTLPMLGGVAPHGEVVGHDLRRKARRVDLRLLSRIRL
jgi:hypothetical protein